MAEGPEEEVRRLPRINIYWKCMGAAVLYKRLEIPKAKVSPYNLMLNLSIPSTNLQWHLSVKDKWHDVGNITVSGASRVCHRGDVMNSCRVSKLRCTVSLITRLMYKHCYVPVSSSTSSVIFVLIYFVVVVVFLVLPVVRISNMLTKTCW